MIELNITYPFARYNLRGQQHSVESNRRSIEWLISELESRVLLSPAYSNWDVAMLIDNQSKGSPQRIARYYQKILSKEVKRVNAQDWPQFTKQVFEFLSSQL